MEEVDGRISRDYESRLADALRQMREDYEYQIRTTREETEEVWLNKVNMWFDCSPRGSVVYRMST